jgi:hypothetical protein
MPKGLVRLLEVMIYYLLLSVTWVFFGLEIFWYHDM